LPRSRRVVARLPVPHEGRLVGGRRRARRLVGGRGHRFGLGMHGRCRNERGEQARRCFHGRLLENAECADQIVRAASRYARAMGGGEGSSGMKLVQRETNERRSGGAVAETTGMTRAGSHTACAWQHFNVPSPVSSQGSCVEWSRTAACCSSCACEWPCFACGAEACGRELAAWT